MNDTLHTEAISEFAQDVAKRKAVIQKQEPYQTSVDLPCQVSYNFTPSERRTHGHPGQDASVDAVKVRVPGLSAAGAIVDVYLELPRDVVRWMEREIVSEVMP